MKELVLILAICSLFELAISEDMLATITLKNSSSLKVNVEQVLPWGLKLDNNQTALFKVIFQVNTRSIQLLEKIKKLIPDISYYLDKDSSFVMNFENQKLPVIQRHYKRLLYNFFLQIFLSTSKRNRADINLNFGFNRPKWLVFQFGLMVGRYNEDRIIYYNNSTINEGNRLYHFDTYIFGCGFFQKFHKEAYLFLLNYGRSVINSDKIGPLNDPEDFTEDMLTLSFDYHRYITNKPIFLIPGINIIITDHFDIHSFKDRVSLRLGLGVIF